MNWRDLIRRSGGFDEPENQPEGPNPSGGSEAAQGPSPQSVDPFAGHVSEERHVGGTFAAGIDYPEEPEHENPTALVDAEFDGPPAGASIPNDPGTKPPGPPVYVDLDDQYPMRRVPTRWEQRQLRSNIEYLYLGGGAGGAPQDPTLRPDIDQNKADIADLSASEAVQDGRLDALEAGGGSGGGSYDDTEVRGLISDNADGVADNSGRLDALEALDPYDDADLVARLDQIDADQIVQDDGIAANKAATEAEKNRNNAQDVRLDDLEAIDPYDDTDVVARLDQIDADQIVQDSGIADAAAEASAASAKNKAQDARLDALEAGGVAPKTEFRLRPTASGAGASAWQAGQVYAQEGSHHDLNRITHYVFPEFDLDGDPLGIDDVSPGAVLDLKSDVGHELYAVVVSVDPDGHAPTAAGRWLDIYVEDQQVIGDSYWPHWRGIDMTATFTNPVINIGAEIDRLDEKDAEQDGRLDNAETRLDGIDAEQIVQDGGISDAAAEAAAATAKNKVQDGRLDSAEKAITDNADAVAVERAKNAEQDDRISLIESVEDSDGDIYGTYKCVSSSSAPMPGQIRAYPVGTPDSISLIDNIKIHRVGLNGNEHALDEIDAGEHIRLTSPQKDWVQWTVVSATDKGDWYEVEVDPASIVATDVNASWSSDFVNYTKVAFSLKQQPSTNGGGGGSYDDTQVKADIAQNATDIAGLVAAEAVQDGRLDGIDTDQQAQDSAIAKNATDIAANAKALTDHNKDQKAHPTLTSNAEMGQLPDENGDPRVGRLFNVANYMPVGFSSTGGYKPIIRILRNEPGAPNSRSTALEIHADGKIQRFWKLDDNLGPGVYVWKEAMDEAIETAIDAIPDATIDLTANYDWTGKHQWLRTGDNRSDWIIYGRSKTNPGSSAEQLMSVYRNVSGTPDAVNYMGKSEAADNLINVGGTKELIAPLQSEIDSLRDDLTDALAGAITQRSWSWVSTSAAAVQDGKFWTNSPSDWNRLTALRISDVDEGGKVFPVDLINESDIIEMTVISGGAQVGRAVMLIQSAAVVGSSDRAVDITPAGWSVQEGRPPNQSGDSCLFSWSPSTNEYATEAYVDAAISAIDIPDHPTIVNIEYESRYLGMNSGAWGNTLASGNTWAAYQASNATTTSNWWGNIAQFRFASNTGDVPKTLTTTSGIYTGEIIISETNANGGEVRWRGGASWGHSATVERWRDYIIWFKGGHKVSAHGSQAEVNRDYHISVIGYPLKNPVR